METDDQSASAVKSKKRLARLKAAEFAATTSGHGYRKLVEPRGGSMASLLWLLCLLGALAGLGYHLYLLATQYFAFDKRILTFQRLEPLPFPKVIICPTTYWSDHLLSQPGPAQLVRSLHSRLLNESSRYYTAGKDAEREAAVDKMLLDTYIEGRLPELDYASASLDTFLLTCSFNFGSCSATNFSRIVSDRYGFCYMFRPASRMIYGGYDSGLTLTLAYEGSQEAYLTESLRYSRGYAAIIASYDKYVNFFRAAPVAASVGVRTEISMLLQQTHRLSSPNDPCTRSHLVVDQIGDTDEFDFDSVNCVDMSLSNSVFNRCGCATDLLPVPPSLMTSPRCMRVSWNRTGSGADNLTIANISEVFRHQRCQDAVIRSYEDLSVYQEHVANCQKACREDSIVTHASSALLPSGVSANSTWSRDIERLLKQKWSATSASANRSFLPALINTSSGTLLPGVNPEKHVVQLNVFFASSTVAVFEENWQYSTESFLSEGGGTLGLWMGASVLTVMEVLEFFTAIIVIAFSNRQVKTDNLQASTSSDSTMKDSPQSRSSTIQVRPAEMKEKPDVNFGL